MSDMQNLNWFPGHMAKTLRQIRESLSLIDGVIEIVDARIPISSRNPDIIELTAKKPRIMILNKTDIADEVRTREWTAYFKGEGMAVICANCKTGAGLGGFSEKVRSFLCDVTRRNAEKGMSGKTLRLMVVGIPNSGKSSFINRVVGGSRAKVADKPGVTRGSQWFTVSKGIELMDTPGVLWPKFESNHVGERLAFTGAIKDEINDLETLAVRFIGRIRSVYPDCFNMRYGIGDISELTDAEVLEAICRRRGMIISRGEPDYQRASVMLLDEFRGGKLGRITLESVV